MTQKPKEYRLSPRAVSDLEDIWLYTFQTWSPDQADIYHRKIMDGVDRILEGTSHSKACDHIRQGYFKCSVGSHLVFYREATYGIEVVRILHQSMDIERHL
jgi:toxin ParE1/3/4